MRVHKKNIEFIRIFLLCIVALPCFAQQQEAWSFDDTLSGFNKNLVARTEQLFKSKKLHSKKSYEHTPYEVYASLMGGISQNLISNLFSNHTLTSSIYQVSEYTPNNGFLWGLAVGFRKDRHIVEPSIVFAKASVTSLIDDASYQTLFQGNPDETAVSVSDIGFSTKTTEVAVRYKYLLYSSSWFEWQVGGMLGMVFSSDTVYNHSGYSTGSSPQNISYSFVASGKSSPYNSFYVGGLIGAGFRLSQRWNLGIELGLQYNVQPLQVSLNYKLYNAKGNIPYTNTANANLSANFLLFRPLLRLSYHIPIKTKRKTPVQP